MEQTSKDDRRPNKAAPFHVALKMARDRSKTTTAQMAEWFNLDHDEYLNIEKGKFLPQEGPLADLRNFQKDDDLFQSIQRQRNEFEANRKAGPNINVAREASFDEACIGVHAYAHVLATFLKGAHNKLSMAIYAPWGRGKTYLVDFAEKELRKNDIATVRFNAWKYKNAAETWAFLYQTTLNAAKKTNPFVGLRANLIKHGQLQFLWLMGCAFVFNIPAVFWAQTVLWLIGTCAVVALIVAYRFFALSNFVYRRISKLFLKPATYTDELGLQAAIGLDLSSLMRAWIPRPHDKGSNLYLTFWFGVISSSVLLACTLLFSSSELILSGCELKTDWVVLLMSVFSWWAIFLAYFCVTRSWGKPVESAVLVIDDIDRCHHRLMINVIESICLLVEEPEIEERTKVVMLVDEHRLDKAIQLDFEDDTGVKSDKLIQQQKNKLFLTHLRLPPLAIAEIEELLSAFTEIPDLAKERKNLAKERRKESKKIEDRFRVRPTEPIGSLERTPPNSVQELDELLNENQIQMSNFINRGFQNVILESTSNVFRDNEKAALRRHIIDFAEAPHVVFNGRSIRQILASYQLGRLLVQVRGSDLDPSQLICAVLPGNGERQLSSVYDRVSNEVAVQSQHETDPQLEH